MTLNGFLRQVAAAERRAARDEARRQRLHAREMKLQAKLNELEYAAAQAEAHDERIRQLTTIHHEAGDSLDWNEIVRQSPPIEPAPQFICEQAARHKRNNFKASFLQRLFRREEKIKARLDQDIDEAKMRDAAANAQAQRQYQQSFSQWQALNQLASAITQGDTRSYYQAVTEMNPLSEILEMGVEITIAFPDANTAEVNLTVEGDKVVPREIKTLTRSGKLSIKPMAQGKFHELYQDYVCGCALRSARELFSFLPLCSVVVHVDTTMLDSATGHLGKQTILSAGLPRRTIESLNFSAVDPSEAMKLFSHRMGFKRSQGFSPIRPLDREEYPVPQKIL